MKSIFFFLMFSACPLRADMDLNAEIYNELEYVKDDPTHTAILAQQLATLNPPLTQFFSQWPAFLYKMIVQQDKPRFCLVVMMSMLPASQNFIRQHLHELKSLAETYNGDLRLSFVGGSRFEANVLHMQKETLSGNKWGHKEFVIPEKMLTAHWIDPLSEKKSLDNLESLILSFYPTHTFEDVVVFLFKAYDFYQNRYIMSNNFKYAHFALHSTFKKNIPHGTLPWVIGASYTEKGSQHFALSGYRPTLIQDIKNHLHLEDVLPTEKKEGLDHKNVIKDFLSNRPHLPAFKKNMLNAKDLQKLVSIVKKLISYIEKQHQSFVNILVDCDPMECSEKDVDTHIKNLKEDYEIVQECYEELNSLFPEVNRQPNSYLDEEYKEFNPMVGLFRIVKDFFPSYVPPYEEVLDQKRIFLKKFIEKNRNVLFSPKMIKTILQDVCLWLEDESPNKEFSLSQPLIPSFQEMPQQTEEDPEKKAYRLFIYFREELKKYQNLLDQIVIEREYKERKEKKESKKIQEKIEACRLEAEKVTMQFAQSVDSRDPCWRLKEVIGNLDTADNICFLFIPLTSPHAEYFLDQTRMAYYRQDIAWSMGKKALVFIALPHDEVSEYIVKELSAQTDVERKSVAAKNVTPCPNQNKSIFLKFLLASENWDHKAQPEKIIASFDAWLKEQGKTPLMLKGVLNEWPPVREDIGVFSRSDSSPHRNQNVFVLKILKENGKITRAFSQSYNPPEKDEKRYSYTFPNLWVRENGKI